MNTPFFDKIKKLSKLQTRFFVPGHKGKACAIKPFEAVLKYDITEINGADDLQNPAAELLQSQKNMAKAFSVGASVYSAHGCTSCIEAMLTVFLNAGDTVVMARNSHASAMRACAFLELAPAWIVPNERNKLDTEALEALVTAQKAKAVYITSPSYYGFISNIPEIASVCQKHNIPLLVDNAHGAYMRFLSKNNHPIHQGAAASADSVHKTLPCLTGGAVLQLADERLAQKARWAVNLYSSTSPSYLILSSLDLLAGKLIAGKIPFKKAEKLALATKATLGDLCVQGDDAEPFKITLAPKKVGVEAQEILEKLRANKIEPEMADENYIVLMASAYTTKAEFKKLIKVLEEFVYAEKRDWQADTELKLPRRALSPRRAIFSETISIKTENAKGKIAAAVITPCPPGIPVVMPGEIIEQTHIDQIIKSGIYDVDVVK